MLFHKKKTFFFFNLGLVKDPFLTFQHFIIVKPLKDCTLFHYLISMSELYITIFRGEGDFGTFLFR